MDRVSWGLRKLAGLGPESSPPDAQLLALHRLGDSDALVLILERHGPAIWRVCRARLPQADADDAFQATVVSFLKGARSIRSPDLLGAWLVRVAALTARKAAGRRRGAELIAEPPGPGRGPDELAAGRDALAAVVAEVARLPAKARAVVTLCVLEGQSTKEAARVLAIPPGTADTRLAAAKALLRKRLARLGLAPSLMAMLADPSSTASAARQAARLAELAPVLVRGAPPAILALTITGGITMTTAKILTAVALVGCGAGAAGWGVWRAGAEDQPKAVAAAKAGKPAKPGAKPAGKLHALPPALDARVQEETATRRALAGPSGLTQMNKTTLGQLFEAIQRQHNLFVRIDYDALKRLRGLTPNAYEDFLSADVKPLERRIVTDITDSNIPLRDLLEDVLARTYTSPLAVRTRGNQILIGPAIPPLSVPGVTNMPEKQAVEHRIYYEIYNGPPVSASFTDATLAEVLAELRLKSGENLVAKLPPDYAADAVRITATFDNVRLATVLEVVGDTAGLRPVVLGTVFYLTDPDSAERLQEKVNREVFGKTPTPASPWDGGGVGGGLGTPGGMGFGGLGAGGGGLGAVGGGLTGVPAK